MNKLLSIVIPTRNRKKMISICLESVEKYLEFSEIIIVSNGESIENDIPTKYLESDKFKKVRSENRLSMSQNWLYGFQFVKNKWVIYLADDDFLVIEPLKLYNSLISAETDALLYTHKHFNWDRFVSREQEVDKNKKLKSGSQNTFVSLKNKKHRFWYMENINRIPSGSATSIIKKDFLKQLNETEHLFNGISPDWNTAAHFFYSNLTYTKINEDLVYIGMSSVSSISLARDPNNSKFKSELALSPEKNLHHRISNFSISCPTTWLSRIDSILNARDREKLPINLSDDILAISALNTTPRYVYKMLIYIKPNVKTKIPIIIIFCFMLSFSLIIFCRKKVYKVARI